MLCPHRSESLLSISSIKATQLRGIRGLPIRAHLLTVIYEVKTSNGRLQWATVRPMAKLLLNIDHSVDVLKKAKLELVILNGVCGDRGRSVDLDQPLRTTIRTPLA